MLRWVIAYTIVHSRVTGVKDWALSTMMNPAYGIAREPFIRIAPKLGPREKVTPVLVSVLGEVPGHAAFALAKGTK